MEVLPIPGVGMILDMKNEPVRGDMYGCSSGKTDACRGDRTDAGG
ncbi:hypothetical protein [Poriferisphaera corsica]|nr:hypothetical protein [Poriferisphaera corsica]